MLFEVTIKEATLEDLKGLFGQAAAAKIVESSVGFKAEPVEEKKAEEADKAEAPKKPAPKKTKPAPKKTEEVKAPVEEVKEEAPAEEVKEAPAEEKKKPVHTLEDVKNVLVAKKKAGKNIAIVIKDKLGLNKLSELTEDRFDEAFKYAEEL